MHDYTRRGELFQGNGSPQCCSGAAGCNPVAVSVLLPQKPLRMGGRVVEGTGLENRQTRKRLEGSNPSPSANSASASDLR